MGFKNIKAAMKQGGPSAEAFDVPFGKSEKMPKKSPDTKGPNKKSGLAARLMGK